MGYAIIEIAKRGDVLKQISPLERAIEYIENHLNENIGLSDVSRETGYSYYHMTRLFSSVLGESVGRYINRRRLYNAAEKLIHSDQRVIDIALDCGFESSEAFSRAFKLAFGSSPTAYRKAGLDLVVNAKRKLAPVDVGHIANNISRSPELVMLKETRVAGLRGTTSLFDNRLPGLWEEFMRLHKDLFVTAGAGYGICETQQTVYTKDGDVMFAAMVGSPVNTFDDLPLFLPLDTKILRAGKFAVFTHRGTFANLFKTYQYIFGTWLPAAIEELDDREDFEVYEREVSTFDAPDNEVKIYIPIK
ncbi:AraC family transcriptional regulator [Lactonifactor longoviformis]|uniref:AraC family transcriptional regulator n=1 Tax=Lactonifactor longoviformis TaxID=341220 RepID=UPI001D00B79F|nr:AraC family transcriptional regulator [Lactonifactor longoviformis]MCB5712827.1 AraC family transcriptional regulator [Lactonifactor longoviformis]MCB5717095.1 AraC family transcriptional regulator [Lactonifactor longoviformis]MCQ4670558.1 AraC family transcriptional regulator [Lactonifactor longoviformis]